MEIFPSINTVRGIKIMTTNNSDLLKNINIKELLNEAPFLYLFENDSTAHKDCTIDSVAFFTANENSLFMSLKKPDFSKIKPAKAKLQYWQPVKKEFITFLCTDDPKYDELRQAIKTIKTPAAIYIAAFVGAKIGVEPTKIVGFCSICLYFAIKIHKEAFCTELKKNL